MILQWKPNKSLRVIGHACLFKMAGYWPCLFGQDGWILATLVWSRWLGIGHACLVKMAGYWPRLFGQDGWVLVTLVWSRWLGIGQVLFCVFMDLYSILVHKHGIAIFSWAILSKGERCNEVNPMWSTYPWDKARPQHRELRVLLFMISIWVL